eukprot:g18097.t1
MITSKGQETGALNNINASPPPFIVSQDLTMTVHVTNFQVVSENFPGFADACFHFPFPPRQGIARSTAVHALARRSHDKPKLPVLVSVLATGLRAGGSRDLEVARAQRRYETIAQGTLTIKTWLRRVVVVVIIASSDASCSLEPFRLAILLIRGRRDASCGLEPFRYAMADKGRRGSQDISFSHGLSDSDHGFLVALSHFVKPYG